MTDRGNQRQQLSEAALAYANTGWPVFPLRPGTKRPATPNHTADTCDGTDPRCAWNGHTGWEQRATTDLGRITRAWDRHPYGIGIACGPAGLIVIDLDTAKPGQPTAGTETLAQLEHDHGQVLPATWTVATPSGGRHLYYLRPPSQQLGNTAGKVGPGIDTRANGGYVVAPPTVTGRTDGGDYWLVDDHPPADLPDWFGQLLATPPRLASPIDRNDVRPKQEIHRTDRVQRYVAKAVAGEHHRIAAAPPGQRNHSLFCASVALGQLVGAGLLDLDDAEQRLLSAAQAHVSVGAYSLTQARLTTASGLRTGTREPRHLPTNLTGAA